MTTRVKDTRGNFLGAKTPAARSTITRFVSCFLYRFGSLTKTLEFIFLIDDGSHQSNFHYTRCEIARFMALMTFMEHRYRRKL